MLNSGQILVIKSSEELLRNVAGVIVDFSPPIVADTPTSIASAGVRKLC